MLLFVLMCSSPAGLVADHLPEKLIARGKPEHVLCGIDVYRTTPQTGIAKLGKPSARKQSSPPDEHLPAGSGYVDYEWSKLAHTCKAAAYFRTEHGQQIETELYWVELSGTDATSDLARTGSGLRLGSDLKATKAIYGDRFLQKTPSSILIQFTDETELSVEFDDLGKAKKITLMANIE